MVGGAGEDDIDGGKGHDDLSGGDDDAELDGGKDFDTAVDAGSVLDFTWTETGGDKFDVTDLNLGDGDECTDEIKKFEALQFDDFAVFIDGTNNAPLVDVETNETDEDTVLAFGVNAYDFDGDNLTLAAVAFTGLGTLTQTGTTTLSPAMGTGAQYGFSFDSGAEYQYLAMGESITETLSVTVTDDQRGSSSYNIDVTITGQNDAPVALEVAASASEDGPAVLISANFADIDGSDMHTFSVDDTGTLGIVTNNGDGIFSYDANGQFEDLTSGETATDTFTYTDDDGNGGSDTETVTITVNGQNDAPDAEDEAVAVANEADALFVIDLNDYVTDPDINDTLTFSAVSIGRGLVPFSKNGSLISFNPSILGLIDGKSLATQISFTATDQNGASDSGKIELTINGANDPGPGANDAPVANNFAIAADEADGALSIDLTPHISDANGDTLTIVALTVDGDEIQFDQVGNTIIVDLAKFGLVQGQQGVSE